MKAIISESAKKVLSDSEARKELSEYITSGDKEPKVITSKGKKYKIEAVNS
ncbi:hypothetical protein [Spirochaeta cellobiosiphila]|uniref:hypothetical protein n=1 Tax=Spirochaeta cellobiosiphila TaxID=504483 RepID=UPI000428D9CA|nr:hypothetical protein [Spirochaeta cellobiosiphila]